MVTAWQSWTQIENYSAIHNIAFATKANGYQGLDCELVINNPKVVNHIARLKSWMGDKRFVYGGQKYQGPSAEFIAQNAAVYIDSISAIAKLQKGGQGFSVGCGPAAGGSVDEGASKLHYRRCFQLGAEGPRRSRLQGRGGLPGISGHQ